MAPRNENVGKLVETSLKQLILNEGLTIELPLAVATPMSLDN